MDYSDTLRLGSTLNDEYEIIRILGTGGFGNTYLARDLALDREVAIKEYFPREVAVRENQTTVRVKGAKFDDSFKWGLDRFVQEAKLIAKFRHPNIVRVFRTFDVNSTAYIVLDFVQGMDMEVWLRSLGRRPTQQEMDALLAPLANALTLVHSAGVLHRDVKPANIYIREETGDPVLLDFGASKYALGELTGTTAAIVSRGYSPYEAYATDSKSQGPWTDIYGLGATIYRALMDTPPPEATERLLDDSIVSLKSQALPGFRPEFLAATEWALGVQPKNRPQSVEEWQRRLLTGSDPITANWQAHSSLVGAGLTSGNSPAAGFPTHVPAAATARKARGFGSAGLMLGGLLMLSGAGVLAATQFGLLQSDLMQSMLHRLAPAPQSNGSSAPAEVLAAPPSPPSLPPVVVAAVRPPVEFSAPAASVQPPVTPKVPTSYEHRSFGDAGRSTLLSAAAISPDGSLVAGGDLAGGLRYWSTDTGQERELTADSGAAVLAVDFVGVPDYSIAAGLADGSIAIWGPDRKPLKSKRGAAPSGGFLRALGYSEVTNDIVTIGTSAQATTLSRWPIGGDAAVVTHNLGGFMTRAAVLARNADLAVLVRGDEVLEAFRYSTGNKAASLDWIPPALNWTRAIALTRDGRLLATGGDYATVTVYDLEARKPIHVFKLGEQAQTRALSFSGDRRRLAIDYQSIKGDETTSRIAVYNLDTGREQIEVESAQSGARWLSFLPPRGETYWFGATQAGAIRVCTTDATCRIGTALR